MSPEALLSALVLAFDAGIFVACVAAWFYMLACPYRSQRPIYPHWSRGYNRDGSAMTKRQSDRSDGLAFRLSRIAREDS